MPSVPVASLPPSRSSALRPRAPAVDPAIPSPWRRRAAALALRAWALPCTLPGLALALAALLSGGSARLVGGVLEAEGGVVRFVLRHLTGVPGGALALTLGHVVLGASVEALARTRAHERAHVRQAERLGPFFIPAYLGASLLAALQGGHPYRDNHFEGAAERSAARHSRGHEAEASAP